MIAPPVPRRSPSLVLRTAPISAPTPATAYTSPSWKAVSWRSRKLYGATTTSSTAWAANQRWVATANRASPDPP